MAEITRITRPSLATVLPGQEHQINGLVAGEALTVGDFVYIKNSDKKVYKGTGAAANEAARVRGVVLQEAAIGDGVTIHRGVVVNYGAAATANVALYLSDSVAGGLANVATTGGTAEIAYFIDATRLYVKNL